jgi:hypothetical protein
MAVGTEAMAPHMVPDMGATVHPMAQDTDQAMVPHMALPMEDMGVLRMEDLHMEDMEDMEV